MFSSRTIVIVRVLSVVFISANPFVCTRVIMCSSSTNNVKPSNMLAVKLADLSNSVFGSELLVTLSVCNISSTRLLEMMFVVADNTNSTVITTVVIALCNCVPIMPSLRA